MKIPLNKKIDAIKALRQFLFDNGFSHGGSLKHTKLAIENWDKFIAYVSQKGFPRMDSHHDEDINVWLDPNDESLLKSLYSSSNSLYKDFIEFMKERTNSDNVEEKEDFVGDSITAIKAIMDFYKQLTGKNASLGHCKIVADNWQKFLKYVKKYHGFPNLAKSPNEVVFVHGWLHDKDEPETKTSNDAIKKLEAIGFIYKGTEPTILGEPQAVYYKEHDIIYIDGTGVVQHYRIEDADEKYKNTYASVDVFLNYFKKQNNNDKTYPFSGQDYFKTMGNDKYKPQRLNDKDEKEIKKLGFRKHMISYVKTLEGLNQSEEFVAYHNGSSTWRVWTAGKVINTKNFNTVLEGLKFVYDRHYTPKLEEKLDYKSMMMEILR